MLVIARHRASGKTLDLIRHAATHGGYIVVTTHAEAVRIANVAQQIGASIPFPLTASEFVERRFAARGVRRLWFDDADRILRLLASGVEVAGLTVTTTEEPSAATARAAGGPA